MANKDSSMISVNDDSASAPHLMCYFRTRSEIGGDVGEETTSEKTFLVQETGKKSSFLLQRTQGHFPNNKDGKNDIDWYYIPKPAYILVEHPTTTTESNKDRTFFFGGLQLVFDANNIEIYLTSPGGKESYLMTCKGIPYKMKGKENVAEESKSIQPKIAEWRRALCVVPGGPRCISCLRIKLVGSTSASDSTGAKVQFLKLTARIVDYSPSSTRTSTLKSPIATTNPVGENLPSFNPNMFAPATTTVDAISYSEPPLTQKDLGAAMAGLSFMARKTEENMTDLFKQQSKKIEDHLESYFTRMELQMRALKPTLAMQHDLVKENQTILKEQQQIIDCQTTQINKLLNNNQDLQVRVQSLQADISILRSQASYIDTGEANACSNQNEADMSEAKVTAKRPSSNPLLLDAEYSTSAVPGTEEINIEMENIHLRNVIQNIARGIDEEPLLGGCGGTAMIYPHYAALGNEENNIETENIHLRNVIQNIARDIDEEPLLEGCGGTTMIYPRLVEDAEKKALKRAGSEGEIETKNNYSQKTADKLAKEIEEMPLDGGCGYILHGIEGDIMRKIDSAISPLMKPLPASLDTTRSIKNIQKKNCEELYNHTPNIEVTLVQDEHTEEDKEENDNSKVSVDEELVD